MDVHKIVTLFKIKYSDKSLKYFIGYGDIDVIRPLYIKLSQMSGFIKYFDNGGKNVSFMVKYDNALVKYSEIWNKIKELASKKLHDKYIKTKIITFINVIITNFHKQRIPKENTHYVCLATITVESIMKMDEKYCLHVYLEKCK